MNSINIAPKLEELYPSPSLQLESNAHVEAQEVVDSIIQSLVPYWLPKIGHDVLMEEDRKWFFEVQVPKRGLPLEDWESRPAEQYWEAVKPGLKRLEGLLERDMAGPFILGEKPSYGDFVIVAAIKMFEFGEGKEDLEKFLAFPAVRKLWEACGEWMVKED